MQKALGTDSLGKLVRVDETDEESGRVRKKKKIYKSVLPHLPHSKHISPV